MKKIILLLFSFSFFLYGYILDYDSAGRYSGIYLQYNSLGSYKSCNSNINFILDGVGYQITLSGKSSEFNLECIKNNSIKKDFIYCSGSYSFSHVAYIFNDDFCKNKPGYVYNPNDNVWYPSSSDSTPICPPGKDWNGTQCIGLNDCPAYTTLYNGKCAKVDDVIKNVLSGDDLDYYLNHCKLVDHSIQVNGKQLCSSDLYCDGEFQRSFVVSCGKTSNDSNSSINKTCEDGQYLVVTSNGEVYCEDINSTADDINNLNNVSQTSSNTNASSSNASNNSNNSNNNQSNNNSGNSDTNQSNNSNKVDCCKYFKSGHGQWTSVNGCLEYTIPETGQKCRIKDYGLKCYECNSDNSSDSNSSASINDIATKIDQTNSRLNKINNTLNDIINLKPSHTPDGNLSSDEVSIFSGFTDTITNTKKALSDLTDSANKLKDLISNPKKFTLFSDNNIVTCPIVTNIYHNEISVDICKFISPYKPILELFFTLVFSLGVIFYFFDVILKGGNK